MKSVESETSIDMEHFRGNYQYQPLRECDRRLRKKPGYALSPEAVEELLSQEDVTFVTGSTRSYDMVVTGEIRVLLLLPGSFDDPIECRLLVQSIEARPQYDALSYQWGDPTDVRNITLDNDHAFPITVSLDNALRHLRLKTEIRRLWADAICINQNDRNERGNQVSIMKEIYSRARSVQVWLDVEVPCDAPSVKRLMNLKDGDEDDDLGDDPDFWTPLVPVLRNTYWDRLWVQQELVFAPKLEFICRSAKFPGQKLMSFQTQMFRRAIKGHRLLDAGDDWFKLGESMKIRRTFSRRLGIWRRMIKHRGPVEVASLKPISKLRQPTAAWALDYRAWGSSVGSNPINLLGMLRYAQSLQVTDARDRIVATMSLAIDYDEDGSPMDYSRSLADLYLSIASILPFKCNSLQFLPQAKLLKYPDPTVLGLASWAPNWNPPCTAGFFLGDYHASGDLPMYEYALRGAREGVFRARGFVLDGINQELCGVDNSLCPLSTILDLVFKNSMSAAEVQEKVMSLAHALTSPAIMENQMDRLYFSETENTLYMAVLLHYASITPGLRICDLLSRINTNYPNSDDQWIESMESLQRFRKVKRSPIGQLDLCRLLSVARKGIDQCQRFSHFIVLLHQTLSSGCFGTCDSGGFVIVEGNANVIPGDEIWIVFGCPTPMVLRPSGTRYVVVSPAHMHNMMEGEAVEGVNTPDKSHTGGWESLLKTGLIGPDAELEVPYTSGKDKRQVRMLDLC